MVTKGLSGRRCQSDLPYTLPRRAMLQFRTQSIHPLIGILCPLGTWPWRFRLQARISLILWLMYVSRNCTGSGWCIKAHGLFCIM